MVNLTHVKQRTLIEAFSAKPIRNDILFDGGDISNTVSHAVFRHQGNPAIADLVLREIDNRVSTDSYRAGIWYVEIKEHLN